MDAAPQTAVREQTALRTDPIRVLVVDDSPTVRAVFARLIGEESDLEVAATARESLSGGVGKVKDYIGKQPTRALGVAFGLGVLLGWLIKRR